MEMNMMEYPRFTPEMKDTHTILIPNMAPVQFRILAAAMKREGYTCELLENCGSQVSELGLKYVHNDTCVPARLVIGQFIDALHSGKYDLNKVALAITQTGGGCRARGAQYYRQRITLRTRESTGPASQKHVD